MIHVNPFDTGFDENSHVMRFSAIARDIFTTTHTPAKFVARKPEIAPPAAPIEMPSTSSSRPAIPREMLKAGPSAVAVEKVVVHAPEDEGPAAGGAEDHAGMIAVASAVSPRESEVERVEVEEEVMASVEGQSSLLSAPRPNRTEADIPLLSCRRRGGGHG